MKNIRKANNIDKILIVVVVVLILLLGIIIALVISASRKNNADPSTTTMTVAPDYNTGVITPPTTGENITPQTSTTEPKTTVTTQRQNDPSQWTVDEILKFTSDAVNKTKAYTGNVSCIHKESFDAQIKETSAGAIIKNTANNLISKFTKPTDETWNFSNGTALDSKGKAQSLLLPNNRQFTLPASGIAKAYASKSGEKTIIDITLVDEKVSLGQIPQYNANTVGFLDLANMDLKVAKVKSATIDYTGTSIRFVVRPDGYVESANYNMYVTVVGQGTGFGITGSATFVANQTENWQLLW